MASPEEIEAFKSQGQEIVAAGEDWFLKLEHELKEKYPGEFTVVINIADGSYVAGKSELEAIQKAEKEFPASVKAYVRGIAVRSRIEFGCPDWEAANARLP